MKLSKWLILYILLQLVLFGILVFLILENGKQQGVAGPKGDRGDSAVVDYKSIDNYIDNKVNEIPRPLNGQNATPEQISKAVSEYLQAHPPADGKDGRDGNDGSTGETGATGPAAPKYQQRCKDFTNKKSQVQYKYEDEEAWKLLYELPHKCNGSLV